MLLKAYLTETGETIQQFAERVGESPHTIGKLYRGERFPRSALAKRIIAATNGRVTADDMLAAVDEPDQQAAA